MTKTDFQCQRFFEPKEQRAIASAVPGKRAGNKGLVWWRIAAVVMEVLTVSVVEAMPPDGVSVVGEKLHVAPEGKPEHVKARSQACILFEAPKSLVGLTSAS
jgi:hypothetical protein